MTAVPAEFLSGEPLCRAAADLTLDEEQNQLTGRVVPYEEVAELGPTLREVFTRGAFGRIVKDPARARVFGVGHSGEVIGRAVELRDEPDGLYGTFRIDETRAGKDALILLRSGSITDLSVEFVPDRSGRGMRVTQDGPVVMVRHVRAEFRGVSPVPFGAYTGAKVLSMRDAGADKRRDEIVAHLRALTH